MKRISKAFPVLGLALCAASLFAPQFVHAQQAPVAADVIVVMDESGSMSGEQRWSADMVPLLDEGLQQYGIGSEAQTNLYGLVGFGNNRVVPRTLLVDSEEMGSPEGFVRSAGTLMVNGGTEDGWRGIEHALDEYPRRNGAAVNIILVTDEDRDNTLSSVTYATVLQKLKDNGALLNAVVNARMNCGNGVRALGMDSLGTGYVADGNGGFTICEGAYATSGSGRTIADYVNLAIENGGAAWDLNVLRSGGLNAQSFSRALLAIKIDEILSQRPTGDLVAVAQATPNPAVAGELITLDGTGSFHQKEDRAITTWEWDLDDDGVFDAYGPVITTRFDSLGEYPVTLRVIDDSETPLTDTARLIVNVSTPPLQPTASSGGPYLFCPQTQPWYLDGSGSVNPDDGLSEEGLPADAITAWEWDLSNNLTFEDASGERVDVTGHFSALGTGDYLVRLRVTDNTAAAFPSSGRTDLSDISVTQVRVRDESDAACNCLTDVAVRPNMSRVQLTWSDSGAHAYGIYRSEQEGGPYERIATTDNRYSTFLDLGLELNKPYYYAVSELGTDGRDLCRSREVRVVSSPRGANPANRPPVIESSPVLAATEGEVYRYQVMATDPDPRDRIDYSLLVAPSGMTINSQTGLIEWTPLNAQVGTQTVIVRAADSQGAFAEQVFAVVVANVNQPPRIVSEPVLSATELQLYSYQVQALDPDAGDRLVYALEQAPAGMTIVAETGLLSWEPQAGQAGTHPVMVRATDLAGETDIQIFTVQVTERNHLPLITSTPVVLASVGSPYQYPVTATDDNQDDTLTFSLGVFPDGMVIDPLTGVILWTPQPGQEGSHSVSVVVSDDRGGSTSQSYEVVVSEQNLAPVILTESLPDAIRGETYHFGIEAEDANATDQLTFSLVTAPSNMVIDPQTGMITWLPVQSQVGLNPVKVRVTDTGGLFDEAEWGLLVIHLNRAPVITSTPPLSAEAGAAYRYDVAGSDPDEDDALSFSLVDAPSGMMIDASTGVIHWLPQAEQEGSHPVRVRVEDVAGAFAEQAFELMVSVINQPPEITSVPPAEAAPDETYMYQVIASDPDGDALVFELPEAPSGMTIHSENGLITWVPAESQAGIQSVVVTVADGRGGVATQSFQVRVNETAQNTAPVIISEPALFAAVGEVYRYQLVATDADGDELTYGASAAPAGMSVDASGLVTWTPGPEQTGSQSVTFFADDGAARALQSVVIQVVDEALPLAVTVTAAPETVNSGETVSIRVDVTGGTGGYSLSLSVDGAVLPVNAGGVAQWTATEAGRHEITATATDDKGSVSAVAYVHVRDPGDTERPVVRLEGPEGGSVITAPTDIIATITDDNLVGYEVLIVPAGGHQWQVIAEGDSNQLSSAVALFDPSMLLNGQYDVAIIAIDANDQSASDMMTLQVEGDLKVGNFSITLKDLEVPLAGLPIQITRTYDSRRRLEALDFGQGWSIGYQDVKVEESRVPGRYWTLNEYRRGPMGLILDFCIEPLGAPVITITLPDGEVERFEVSADPACNTYTVLRDVTLAFTPLGASGSSLRALNDNHAYFMGDGLFESGSYSREVDPSRYELTTASGFVYTLDQNFGIETVRDPNGHTLTYTRDGIFHSSGKAVTFERDSQGRITSITRPDGEALHYLYDGSSNLVVSVDAIGAETGYTYNRDHGLLDIIDPMGRRMIRNIYDESGRMIAQEDNEGNRTTFNHDVEGRQSSVTDRNGNTTFYYYDERGHVTTKVDAGGHSWTYTYDERGNQLSQIDPLGNLTQADFDARNNQLSAMDALGNTVRFTYNSRGQELTIADARGNVFHNTYDSVGNLLTVTDPDGNVSGNNININGLVSRSTDLEGHAIDYTYDADGNKLTETNALGHTTRYTYDANGNLLTETRSRTSGGRLEEDTTTYVYNANGQLVQVLYADGSSTTTEYDLAGNETASTDGLGNRTEYRYDAYGRLLETIHPDGATEARSYDGEGNLIAETDPLGRVTRYTYDALNRVIRVDYPDGSFNSTSYDATGRVGSETDARGNRTRYEYDAAGRRTAVIDELGHRHSFGYDADGNLISETDAFGRTTTYTYNLLDQKVSTRYHDGSGTSNTYDAMGRVLSETDPVGRRTEYSYDALGRLIRVVDSLGGETSYTYNEAGNKLSQTDAEGRVTRWAYDSEGRELSRTLPLGQTETFSYDGAGNRVSHTDFNGQTTSYFYDRRNHLIRTRYADGRVETFGYDAKGNRVSATTPDGTTYYEYDSQDRLAEEAQPDGSVLRYDYDETGNRTQLTLVAAGNTTTTTYSYDELNRLMLVSDSRGNTVYGYDAVGNRASVLYPNGNRTTYEYDALNRLTRLTTTDALMQVLADYRYTLDATGRRVRVDEVHTGRVVRYEYDELYRLTRETVADPVHGGFSAEYQHDRVGNRIAADINGVSSTYTYDDNDRLTAHGSARYTYDSNGNTLTSNDAGQVTRYDYNAANRLVEATTPAATLTFRYNADGIRTQSTANGLTTRFVVDSHRDYAQVLAEITGGSLQVAYLYGDDLISQTRAGQTSYFLHDGHGSVRALTGATGNLTDRYDYDAFGTLVRREGDTENRYRYTGEQYDEGLDQYYLRARYYSQNQGRFTQMDTWMGLPNQPVTLNKYLYTHGDPVNHTDPTGHFGLASFGVASNIRASLATTSVANFSSAITRAVIGTLPAAGRVTTRAALQTMRQCIRKKNGCNMHFNLLIVGFDSPDMIDHIRSAQMRIPRSIMITYDSRVGGSKGGRRWYRRQGGLPSCTGATPKTQSCDEYPMYRSLQGGYQNYQLGMVSLSWVSAVQNSWVGIQYGVIAKAIRSGRVKNRNVVVVTSHHLPTVGIPGSR